MLCKMSCMQVTHARIMHYIHISVSENSLEYACMIILIVQQSQRTMTSSCSQ